MRPTSFIKALFLSATALVPTTAKAEFKSYYIGIDDLPTLTSGTYAGLANPNFNHLSFLYAHTDTDTPASNHYHSKGIFTYAGPAANPTVISSASNYLPEGTVPPLKLSLGTGVYGGKLVVNHPTDENDPTHHFSFLEIGSTQSLTGFASGSGETVLFNSSAGRWNSAFENADLHFELVSLTPGLHIGGAISLNLGLNAPGDNFHLAEGLENNRFAFTPVFWADGNAAPGIYEARFRLVDESGTFGESGVVSFRTEVVPEPSAIAALLIGGAVMLARRRRHAVTAA